MGGPFRYHHVFHGAMTYKFLNKLYTISNLERLIVHEYLGY